MDKPKLLIMVGNIASGKSTWIKNFLETNKTEYIVLSKDALRRMIGAGRYTYNEKLEPIIHENILAMLHHYMKQNINIIIDETNMDKATRKEFLFLTKNISSLGYDYYIIAVCITSPSKEIIKKRIEQRKGKLEWDSTPPEIWMEIWERKQNLFEQPTLEEGFNQIKIID
jgi:predicted kinase